eukprot:COSAG02_NODE_11096_length_1793_cov_2.360094_1_plen_171_part_00
MSDFCEGGACCAAPCSEPTGKPAEDGSLALGSWASGDLDEQCRTSCSPHGDGITDPVGATQNMCQTGGAVEFHTASYESSFVVALAMLALACSFLYNVRRIRNQKAASEPRVVSAVLVSEVSAFLPIAMPALAPEQLSRMSDVVEAVAVMTIQDSNLSVQAERGESTSPV